MKNIFALLIVLALAMAFAMSAFAQNLAGTCVQNAEAKAALYQKFLADYKGTPEQQKIANDSGNEYLTKYGNCPDEDDKKVTQFVQRWLGKYEQAAREFACKDAVNKKTYGNAFRVCEAIIKEQPDNLDWIFLLARAGYANVTSETPDKSLNADAARMAHRAAALIESGKAPTRWEPFSSRDEALGFLYYAHGVFIQETSAADAARAFIKAAQSNSLFKREASTYTYLASIYETNELKQLTDRYKANFPEGQPISDEKKAQADQMIGQIEKLEDRITDAYARAVALLNSDPKADPNRKDAVMKRLTAYYKVRHQDSDTGLAELIARVMTEPLPLPSQ